jgi:iron complex outermembrane recepter protein
MKVERFAILVQSIICLALAAPAGAQSIDPLKTRAPLAESVISQTAPAEVTKIVDVKVVRKEAGVEILLAPAAGTLPRTETRISGNTAITDIPNATITLPQGQAFQAANPTADIQTISVTQLNPTTVRVSITGTTKAPDVAVTASDVGLTLATTTTIETELEVTVTAQKRKERPQDVPISITTIPRQQIEDAGIRTFNDVANNVPNFKFPSTTSGRQFAFYSLRGLSNSNFLSRKDTLGFYVDEVPYEYGAFIDLDLIDLDRVEVLRGPQSTLYGRNSQAGVVNIFTRQPSNNPELRTSATYGSYNDRDLKISASAPLIKDNLLVSVAGGYRASDGFYRNTFLNESAGKQSSIAGRLQFLWKPQPDLTVSLNSNVSAQDDGDILYTSRSNPFQIQNDLRGFVRNNTNTQALKVAYDAKDYRLTSVTTRRFSIQDGENDSDFSSADLIRANYGFSDTAWTQELRVQSPSNIKTNLNWTLGAYAESSDFNAREASAYSAAAATAFGLPAAGTDLTSGQIGQKTYAVFGQVDYKPIDPLTVTAGLRYESSDLRLSSRQRSFTPLGSTTPASVSGVFDNVTGSDSELLPRVALLYRFSPQTSAYASVTRGYKPGAYNYRADTPDVQRIQPERSWNYEIGVKQNLGNKMSINLAAFNHSIDNYQLALQDSTGFFRNITNAKVGITGLELELNANPTEGLNLIAGVGVTNAKFTNYVNPFTGIDRTGNQLPFAANLTYNLAAQYRHPTGMLGRLELVGTGKTFFDDANQISQDPYAIVNARIGYEANDYGVYLFANNLFDTRYINSGFVFPPPNVIASFGAPATYGVQVKANF